MNREALLRAVGRGAAEPLAKFSSLTVLARASDRQLLDAGFSAAQLERLRAVLALCQDYAAESLAPGEQFSSPEQVAAAWGPRLRHLRVEQVWAIALDAKNQVLREYLVAQGGAACCAIAPGQVFATALAEQASAVLVVHNHPSGDCAPSPQDVALTERLRDVADVVGIRLLDHVIVAGGDDFHSFAQ